MAADDITILLGARDNATPVIDKVEDKANKLAGKDLGELLKFGALIAGARVATSVLQDLTAGVAEVRDGTAEWYQVMLRSIPVMGDLMMAAANLRRELDGTAEAERNLIAATKERSERQGAANTANDALRAIELQLSLQEDINKAHSIEERDLAIIGQRYQSIYDKLREIIENPHDFSQATRNRAKSLLEPLGQQMQQDWFDMGVKRANELRQLDDQIAVEQMQAQGKMQEAELEAIRRKYDFQIAEALRALDTEKAAKLGMLKDLALEEARRGQRPSYSPIAGLRGEEQRFLTRAPGVDDHAARTAVATQATAKAAQAAAAHLATVADRVDRLASRRPIEFVEARGL